MEDYDFFLFMLSDVAVPEMSSLLPTAGPKLPAIESLLLQVRSVVVASNKCMPQTDEMLSQQEDNVLEYIAGYIVRRLKNKLCTECQERWLAALTPTTRTTTSSSRSPTHGRTVPSDKRLDTVKQLELESRKAVVRATVGDHVKQTLASELSKKFDMTCLACTHCHLHLLVVHLMINIRLHFLLKNNNRLLVQNKDSKNRKTLKFNHLYDPMCFPTAILVTYTLFSYILPLNVLAFAE